MLNVWATIALFAIGTPFTISAEESEARQPTVGENLRKLDLSAKQEEEIRELFSSLRNQDITRRQRQREIRQGLAKILTRQQKIAYRNSQKQRSQKKSEPVEPVVSIGDEATQAAYLEMAEYSEKNKGISMLIIRDGEVVFEHYPNGGSSDRAHELASGTKSFSGLMAVAAQEDGLLDLDEKVSDTIEEWKSDPRKKEITVKQLLTLTSGIDVGRPGTRVPDYTSAVSRGSKYEPGERFEYGSAPFQVFGELLQRKLKADGREQSALEYLDERILEPCGIDYARWRKDKFGNPHLPSGAALTARDWAKLGQMIVDNGKVDGKRVLKKKSINLCFKGTEQNPLYGLTWWLYRPVADESILEIPQVAQNIDAEKVPGTPNDLVMAAGAGKQRLFISRKEKLVIVRQAEGIAASLVGQRPNYKDAEFLGPLFKEG